MKNGPTWFSCKVIGIIACWVLVPVPGHAQSVSSLRCPSGYGLWGKLCLNNSSGDVVYASTPEPTARSISEHGCRTGYWRLGSLCQSPSTGDVELADDSEAQHAQAKP